MAHSDAIRQNYHFENEMKNVSLRQEPDLNAIDVGYLLHFLTVVLDYEHPSQVFFHVISKGENEDDEFVSDLTIQQQVSVLQSAFIDLGVRWNVLFTTHTINADWYSQVLYSDNDNAMKAMFNSRSSSRGLHIYTVGSINRTDSGIRGTSPEAYQSDPTLDGIVITAGTLPGGSDSDYNQGKILVHEVGHWFGLAHTFAGGCSEPNDGVLDTPQELYPGFCVEKNSCPDSPGDDPIHNYMDYGYDYCLEGFTPGQIAKMNRKRALYRSGP
ncbi:hypothetical protein H0H87_012251 [Tephrocybe sp. NHM501043]|nr:hypothetical protein H0H87_012251 [Tephrocybe sp. NHM501043]